MGCKRCRPCACPQPHSTRTKPCCGRGSGEALPAGPCGFVQAGSLNSGSPFPPVPGARCLTALAPPGSLLGAKRTYSVSSHGRPVCCVLDIPCPHVVVLCAASSIFRVLTWSCCVLHPRYSVSSHGHPVCCVPVSPSHKDAGHLGSGPRARPRFTFTISIAPRPSAATPWVLRVTGHSSITGIHGDLPRQSSACTESNRKSPPASRPQWVGRQRFTSQCFLVGPKN